MFTIQDVMRSPEMIREYVDQQLASRMIAELGYKWPDERVERVAKAMPEFFAVSRDMSWSLSEAIHEELVMYGDNSISTELIGIISPSR